MFKRFASVQILERLSDAQCKKLVFPDTAKEAAVFDYDPANFTYFRCRAITADEANGNGDFFPDDELRKAYKTFIGVGLYKDHDSDSIDKAIGKVLWSDYIIVEGGKNYVECIAAVDKQLAPDLARRVESGIATSVSMGCSVQEAECPICENKAHNPQELCQHMIPGFGTKGRKGPDGNMVFEYNRGLQFTELSIVTVPADPSARIFEVYAKMNQNDKTYDNIVWAIKANMSGKPTGDRDLDEFARAAVEFLLGFSKESYLPTYQFGMPLQTPEALAERERAMREEEARRRAEDEARRLRESEEARRVQEEIERNRNLEQGAAPEGVLGRAMAALSRLVNKEVPKQEVEKKHESASKDMGLKISYQKGQGLDGSFFVATDGKSSYRVAASSVLPLPVQEAIRRDEPGLATPDQIVADLQEKYSAMGDFKAWAKRRRKKNRHAMEKAKSMPDPKGLIEKDKDTVVKEPVKQPEHPLGIEEKPAEVKQHADEALKPAQDPGKCPGAKAAEKKAGLDDSAASADSTGRSEMDKKEQLEKKASETPEAAPIAALAPAPVEETKPEAEAPKSEEVDGTAIAAALDILGKWVASKLGTKREAVKVDSIKSPIDGQVGDKAVAEPKGIQEVAKTEQVKDHSDMVTGTTGQKVASLEKEAMDKNWSLNPKELEKTPSMPKAEPHKQILMSTDPKELSSEMMKAKPGGGGREIAKYFQELGKAKGPGEAPIAVDLKSSKEADMLRKANDDLKAENDQLKKKDGLKAIADKIYELVTEMKEKGLVADGGEEAVVSALTSKFASLEQLEGVQALLGSFGRKADAPASEEVEETPAPEGKVIPQVFEAVQESEDAVQKLSSIWNL